MRFVLAALGVLGPVTSRSLPAIQPSSVQAGLPSEAAQLVNGLSSLDHIALSAEYIATHGIGSNIDDAVD